VIAEPLSRYGTDVAVIRITEVTSTGFSLFIQEAPNQNQLNIKESSSYIVLEEGIWNLYNGVHLEVGRRVTSATVTLRSRSWATVNFTSPFSSRPIVLSQVQTNNDPSWVKTRHNLSSQPTASFLLALEEEEANVYTHGGEIVGWIAMDSLCTSSRSTFWNSNDIKFESCLLPKRVNNLFYKINFLQSYSQSPNFLGMVASYFGSDSCHLRYANLSSSSVQVKIEEDTTNDNETSHVNEDVNYLAIGANNQTLNAFLSSCVRYPTISNQTIQTFEGFQTYVLLIPQSEPDWLVTILTLPTKGSLYFSVNGNKGDKIINPNTILPNREVFYVPYKLFEGPHTDFFTFQNAYGGINSSQGMINLMVEEFLTTSQSVTGNDVSTSQNSITGDVITSSVNQTSSQDSTTSNSTALINQNVNVLFLGLILAGVFVTCLLCIVGACGIVYFVQHSKKKKTKYSNVIFPN